MSQKINTDSKLQTAAVWDNRAMLTIAKVLLALVLIALMVAQVAEHLQDLDLTAVTQVSSFSRPVFGAVCVLMLANWGLEVAKWRLLLFKFYQATIWQAIKSVLSGLALAIVTPARLGEYAGRLLGLPSEHRAKVLLANGVGSIAQNIANISIGLVGCILYVSVFMNATRSTVTALVVMTMVVLASLFILLARLDVFALALRKYEHKVWVRKLINQAAFLSTYKGSDLLSILGLSYARYFVYTLQYVLLVWICGVTNSPMHAMIGVSVIFFVQSGIPLPPVLSVLARGEMAIFIWSVFTTNIPAILSATFLLWAINLLIPSLCGAVLIMKSRAKS